MMWASTAKKLQYESTIKTLSNATTKNAKGNAMQIADFQYKILVVCRALVAVTKG